MRGVCLAVQANDLNNAHLQQLIHARNLVKDLQNVLHSFWHRKVREEYERVPLARRVGLGSEERLNELRRIGNEVLELAVNGVYSEDGVLAHVGVTVFKTRATDGDEGLENFDVLRKLLEEPERCSADVFIGMLL